MAQPDLVSTEKDAVSSTESSLDFLERFSLTLPESFSTTLALRGGGGDSPSSRSVTTLGARSPGQGSGV